jgi:hypothetical protein
MAIAKCIRDILCIIIGQIATPACYVIPSLLAESYPLLKYLSKEFIVLEEKETGYQQGTSMGIPLMTF